MIKCLIVDDEPIARMGMRRLVHRHADIEIGAMVGSAAEAAQYLEHNSVDLIFLDIQMPGLTGLEFARSIPGGAMVIFTTAYSEYALDSYEVDAVDYLVKPIDPERFDRAVAKARQYMQLLSVADEPFDKPTASDTHLIVRADRRYMRIKISDIDYVEGLKDYVIVHIQGRKVVTRMTIRSMEELLPAAQFMRVNKSYIANVERIDSFDGNDIYIGEQPIAIGQSYKDDVLSRLLP